MKSYLIGHFIDVDGISSQAVLGRAMNRAGIEPIHIDITYKDPIAALRQATPEEGEVVRFFDFGYNNKLETPEAMEQWGRIVSRAEVEIYDHHTWPPKSNIYRYAKKVVVPTESDNLAKRCTTQILNLFFGEGDRVSDFLTCVANASDFKDESPYVQVKKYVEKLEQALKGANLEVSMLNPVDIIRYFVALDIPNKFSESAVSKGLEYLFGGEEAEEIPLSSEFLLNSRDFWPHAFEESAQGCKSAVRRAEDQLRSNTYLRTVKTASGTVPIVIGFAHQALYMKEGPREMQANNPGFPIYTCIFEDGSIIFSRDTEEIDLSNLGKAFNGGGRPAGSGGDIPEEWKLEGDEEIVGMIAEKIKQILYNH